MPPSPERGLSNIVLALGAAIPLVLAALAGAAVSRVAGPPPAASALRLRRWLGESALMGLVAATMGSLLLPQLVHGAPFLASDFDQYCGAVAAVRSGDWAAVPLQRGIAGALVPAAFAHRLGIIDGLYATALVARVAALGGIAAWAWAAQGTRVAAVVALAVAVALQPLWTLGSTLSFYPTLVAGSIWCGAAATFAVRRPTVRAVWLAGLLVGLVLVVDVRGVIYALPALVVVGAAVVQMARRAERWAALAGVVAAVAASAVVSGIVVPGYAPGLEQQSLRFIDEAVIRRGADGAPSVRGALEYAQGREFLWGHSGPQALVASLRRITHARASALAHFDKAADAADSYRALADYIGPFSLVGGASVLVALAAAVRRRDAVFVAAAITVLPLVVALHTATVFIGSARYFASGAAAIAVATGAGVGAVVAHLGGRGAGARRRTAAPWWTVPVSAALVLVPALLGWLPSPWKPFADWRAEVWADNEPAATLEALAASSPPDGRILDASCLAGLAADHARGVPVGSWLARWVVAPGEPSLSP